MNQDFLSLSLERSAAVTADQQPQYAPPSVPLILAADDNETHLLYIKRLLESKGFECVTTTSPTAAVRIAAEKRPAAVLCDINFGIGRSNGIDVYTEIRRQDAAVPFIIISAFMQQEMKQRAHDAGITHYLVKPVESSVLMATLRPLISRTTNLQ
ncbi:MAG: response regulator [Bacteroidetes bacterium]|nr:response regulator [Bacteroidota bacterium]